MSGVFSCNDLNEKSETTELFVYAFTFTFGASLQGLLSIENRVMVGRDCNNSTRWELLYWCIPIPHEVAVLRNDVADKDLQHGTFRRATFLFWRKVKWVWFIQSFLAGEIELCLPVTGTSRDIWCCCYDLHYVEVKGRYYGLYFLTPKPNGVKRICILPPDRLAIKIIPEWWWWN